MKLILASTSPYRRALLTRLGYQFSCEKPAVDEAAFKNLNLTPAQLASRLAQEKAQAVAKRFPDSVVIGGDQVAALGEHILDKPGSCENAVAQLRQLQGQTHQLYTAVHLIGPGQCRSLLQITSLTMRRLTETELQSYVAHDQPLDCAGAYKLEQQGIKLFTKIEGEDHDAIVGLPLMALQSALCELGFPLF